MDPQQRLSLEIAWEMFENARIRPSELAGSDTGVFIGASSMDASLACSDDPWLMGPFAMTGNSLSIIANRLSFYYDLQGPSITMDTACSSSLVAVNEACRFLETGGGEYALAGGVNSLYSPFPFIGFSKAQMLAEHGRCKVFDADGNGYVRSEGGVVFLLRRLEDAVRDGNRIHAVIKASGSNCDGMTSPGMSFPNIEGQKRLLGEIYGEGGVDPDSLSYFEAHGTGTAAGDPTEVGALGAVLGSKRAEPLLVGSVKSSIGHLEPASGVAGMLKSILVLKNKTIPPNIHLNNPLGTIDFESLNIQPVAQAQPLPEADGPARIGVNSFGFGGANAHALLEEYRPGEEASAAGSGKRSADERIPLFLSARSEASLRGLAGAYAERIKAGNAEEFAAVAGCVVRDRDLLDQRLVATAGSRDELVNLLEGYALGNSPGDGLLVGQGGEKATKVAFVFSGNGAQWDGMGKALYESNDSFKQAVDEVDAIMAPLLEWSLAERFQMDQGQDVNYTEVSQPMLLAYQVGLLRLLEEKGIAPDMVLGHSVGEVAAAFASGALNLEQACQVIYHRSMVQAKSRGLGRMAVAKISLEQAQALPQVIAGDVEIAASNSATFVTLSGNEEALLQVQDAVKASGSIFRMLSLDYPFHSQYMESFKDELFDRLKGLQPQAASVRFLSCVTGAEAEGETLGVDYWWHNIRDRVEFMTATEAAMEMGAGSFIEIGPNSVLVRFLEEAAKQSSSPVRVLQTMRRNHDSNSDFDKVWKRAFVNGVALDFSRHLPAVDATVDLPVYRWDKVDVSQGATSKCTGLLKKAPSHPLLGYRKDGNLFVWENVLDSVQFPYLADHVVFGDAILPGAAMIEMALAAASEVFEQEAQEVLDLALVRPLPVATSPAMDVRCSINPGDGAFTLESRQHMSAEPWTLNATGRVALRADSESAARPLATNKLATFGEPFEIEKVYAQAALAGLDYGPAFRPLDELYMGADRALCVLSGATCIRPEIAKLDPSLLDGVFHGLLALIPHASDFPVNDVFLPAWFGRVAMAKPGVIKYGAVTLDRLTKFSAVASFKLYDEAGELIASMQECRFIRMAGRDASMSGGRPFTVDYIPESHSTRIAPPVFPSSVELYSTVEQELDGLASDYRRKEYNEEVRPLCQAIIFSHIHSLLQDASLGKGEFTVSGLCRAARLDDDMRPFVTYLLRFLESHGALNQTDGRWTMKQGLDLPSAEVVWRSIVDDYSAYVTESVVLGRLGTHCVQLLRGDRSPDEILSPAPGGMLQALRSDTPSARFDNARVLTIVHALHACLPKGRPIRILEIGTGMGSMLKALRSGLSEEQMDYTCFDSDGDALEALKAAYADADNVHFKPLDIEKELPEDLEIGVYDVIISDHVLHELTNLDKALSNCFAFLVPGGVMLTKEKNPDPVTDVMFGFNPDWWKHSPSPDQPVSTLLPMQEWREPFEQAGFEDYFTLCEKESSYPEGYLLMARKVGPESVDVQQSCASDEDAAWVLVEDVQPTASAQAVGDGVYERLSAAGMTANRLTVARDAATLSGASEAFDLADAQAWKENLLPLAEGGKRLHLVMLAGFDTETAPAAQTFVATMHHRTEAVTFCGQAFAQLGLEADMWVVCGGALGGGSTKLDAVPSQAGAWGAARVVANEVPTLQTRMIDLRCDMPDAGLLDELVNELRQPESAMEVILNGEQRLVPRLAPLDKLLYENAPLSEEPSRVSLTFDTPGKLDNLFWRQEEPCAPQQGEVLIKVQASGLNFRDVMFSMGMLPAEALEDGLSGPVLGLECSGEVVGVGRGVSEFQVGDEVMCMSGPCFDSHVCARSEYVFKKPGSLTFEEAATIPVAFSTAYYSLKTLGDVEPGDKVLIHSAAGGVGLAAIQVARHLGADIIATSGSEEKREFLKLMGIKHVLDSRSLGFYDQVMELTGGKGVDVVLNSLAGEALFKSLKLLKPFGRFLELGKRDFYSNTPLRMRMLRKNISFFGIDLDEFMAFKPNKARAIFDRLIELFEEGEFKPLLHTIFKRADAVEAFKAMQRGQHIGKLVVGFDELCKGVRVLPRTRSAKRLDDSGTVVVTGGLGGLGLATAKRLAENGAKTLVLLGRSGAATTEAKLGIKQLEYDGVTVKVAKADVSDLEQLSTVLDEVLADLPPLAGVVHSAAVLRDNRVDGITPEEVETALAAKAVGAWNLHEYTRAKDIDFFVMYSSVTTVLGNPGQVNYVAANMVLEALAHHRRANGLPAVTYGWGPISDTGMLTKAPEVMASLKKAVGVSPLTADQALSFMESAPEDQHTGLFLFNLDWNRVSNLDYVQSDMFNWIEELSFGGQIRALVADSAKSIAALDRDEAIEALTEAVGIEVAAMLKIPYESMDKSATIAELGLDSLMAVELGLLIEERYGSRISSFSMNVNSDLTALSERIYESIVSSGTDESSEAEELANTMREKHGMTASVETMSKVLDSVNTELEKTE